MFANEVKQGQMFFLSMWLFDAYYSKIILPFSLLSNWNIELYRCDIIVIITIVIICYYSGSSDSPGYSSNAFIFSLRNKEDHPFKSMVKDPSKAIYGSVNLGPTFGYGWDLCIQDNANSNTNSYANFGVSYSVPSGVQDKKTILAGTYKFTPDDVEVFYLSWIVINNVLEHFHLTSEHINYM